MAGNVLIPLLHDANKATDGGKKGVPYAARLLLHFVLQIAAIAQPLLFQVIIALSRFQHMMELVHFDGLEKKVIGPGPKASFHGSILLARGHDNHGHRWPPS